MLHQFEAIIGNDNACVQPVGVLLRGRAKIVAHCAKLLSVALAAYGALALVHEIFELIQYFPISSDFYRGLSIFIFRKHVWLHTR